MILRLDFLTFYLSAWIRHQLLRNVSFIVVKEFLNSLAYLILLIVH